MQAREIQIQQLFQGDVVYVTPSFHRPYRWVDGVGERILRILLTDPPQPLFMGALVTLDLGIQSSGYRKGLLIDGNHRLLTVLMLLLALRDRIRPFDAKTADRIERACLINAKPPLQKNILTPKDRSVFEALVFSSSTPSSGHPLEQVYRMGQEAFQALKPHRLTELAERLLTHATFVELALAKGEDPYPVFKLFNSGNDAFAKAGLDAYTQFSHDPELMEMIAGGESQEVEFKCKTVLQGKQPGDAPSGVYSVVKAVAGFLNSTTGGILLIGVEDDGRICGVEREYALVDRGKSNWDGYQLYLANMLRTKLNGKNAFLHYAIERRSARHHDVCLIRISPAEEPVYLEKHLYVRTNNQTVEMLGPDLVNYVKARFSS
ncbi:MAG: ATP-binding protein [Kiritimatiellae bacterium]|nr:ATP-binding protein [Kiritimatiellia bacterium]